MSVKSWVARRVVWFAGAVVAQPWLVGCGEASSNAPEVQGSMAGTPSSPGAGGGGASGGNGTSGSEAEGGGDAGHAAGGTAAGGDAAAGNASSGGGDTTAGTGGTPEGGGGATGGNGGAAAGNGGAAAGNGGAAAGNGGAAAAAGNGSATGGNGGAAAGNGGAAAGNGGAAAGNGGAAAGNGGAAAGNGGTATAGGEAGMAGSAGSGGGATCVEGTTLAKACGLNGAGTSERHCVQGQWSDFGPCSDPDDCVNGAQQSKACGLNGGGVEIRVCTNGHFGAWSPCSSSDVCVNGTFESVECGLNGNGTKQHSCVNGAWAPFGECWDPDECSDGATEHEACGLNGGGKASHTCVDGAWTDWGACVDPDVCVNGSAQGQLCGLNQHGHQTRQCAAGQWSSWSECSDPDECVNGATKTEGCGPANAERTYTCTNGKWSAGVCAYPAGPCAGDLTITDQATFDLYSRCTSVDGDLVLAFTSQVQSSLTMPRLERVRGSVRVESFYARHIAFPALTSLGADVLISDSMYLFGISAPHLSVIPGDLVVRDLSGQNINPTLTGFDSLKRIGGDLRLFSNLYLETVSFPSLEEVAGDVWLGDDAQCRGNRYKNLNGLSALKTIGGSLVIAGNVWLQDISGLSKLESVGNDLIVRYNPALADLSAFSKLDHVPGRLMIGRFVGPAVFGFSYGLENEIRSLRGLHHLEWVGGDFTLGDVTVTELTELERLTHVGGKLVLSELTGLSPTLKAPPSLDTLGGFQLSATNNIEAIDFDVTSITGDLAVSRGYSLERILFPTLQQLGGRLSVEQSMSYYDAAHPTVFSFPELLQAGSIRLVLLAGLKKLSAFPKLTTVDGELSISWLDAPADGATMIDFNVLTRIGGNLSLYFPDGDGMDAFAKLETVGELSLTSVADSTVSSYYYNRRFRPSDRAFQSLSHATKLTLGGFPNFLPCWAQSLAAQLWPLGGAQTQFWGLPSCTP